MPQMGESVTEGTILEWRKQVGDPVGKDEALVDVSTDKVDAEVPSPAAGTLTKFSSKPDETVPVGTVLGEIEVSGNGRRPCRSGGAVEAVRASGELVDVAFPQMGDSVTEGTVLEWLKQLGDPVAVEEELVEISTDKVDAQMPSPWPARSPRSSCRLTRPCHVGTCSAASRPEPRRQLVRRPRRGPQAGTPTPAPSTRHPAPATAPRTPPRWPPAWPARTASTCAPSAAAARAGA